MGVLSNPFSRLVGLVGLVSLGLWHSGNLPIAGSGNTNVLNFVYLASLGLATGVGSWTTFVFGLVAFNNLPRHTFGNLQAKLFPRYFQLLTLSLSAALASYTSLRGNIKSGSATDSFQAKVLIGSIICSLLNQLIIEPLTTAVMFRRHKLEKEEGATTAPDKQAEHRRLSKRFGMLHGLSSLANLAGLAAAYLHLWHAATKLRF